LLAGAKQSSATARNPMNRKHREIDKMPANSLRAKTGSETDE
jgi:hypothetical protein